MRRRFTDEWKNLGNLIPGKLNLYSKARITSGLCILINLDKLKINFYRTNDIISGIYCIRDVVK